MNVAMRHVSRTASLNGERFPLHVRQETHAAATQKIQHDVTKLIVVSRGTTTLAHEAGEFRIPEGSAVLLPAGHWYSGHPSGQVVTTTAYIDEGFLRESTRWLDVRGEIARPAASSGSGPIPVNLAPTDRSQFYAVMRALLDGQHRAVPTSHRLSDAIHLIALLSQQNGGRTWESDVIRQATALLNEYLDAPWTIRALAQACAISVSQLSRLFQQHLQTSPARYLRAERVRRMAELLISTDDSIETIAGQVGWLDPAHASRAFRRIHGVSPQHYRRMRGEAALGHLQP